MTPEHRRWGIALIVVVALHVLGGAALSWPSSAPPELPPAVLLVELAPRPASPPVAPAAPPTPVPAPARPAKPQPVRPKPAPEAARPEPASAAPAEPAAIAAPPAAPAPPAQEPSSQERSPAVPNWQRLLLAHLERHKRYPPSAQARGHQGIAQVAFELDRQGNVLSARLARSSGYEELDDETVALPLRAQPLPAPPAEVAGERLTLVVPVQFRQR